MRQVNNYPRACGLRLVCLVRSGTNETFDSDGTRLGTSSFTAPRGGFETDKNNLGPHIGLAWNPGGKGSKVLRASYAVFFDQQPLEATSNMLLNPPFVQQALSVFPFFGLGDVFPAGFPGDFPNLPGGSPDGSFPAAPAPATSSGSASTSFVWIRCPRTTH